jgi:hypothetical protein
MKRRRRSNSSSSSSNDAAKVGIRKTTYIWSCVLVFCLLVLKEGKKEGSEIGGWTRGRTMFCFCVGI